jgi:hypothetical protein
MDVLYPRCAGLDIHRDTIVACVRLAAAGGVVRFVETFATTTAELERLSDWLSGLQRHPHRHGGDRRVLEAGLGRVGGGL